MFVFLLIIVAIAIGATAILMIKPREAGPSIADADNAKIDALAKVEGFNPAIVYKGLPRRYGLAVDPASNQFAIAIYGSQPRLYHFGQLVAVEVVKDSDVITTTKGKVHTGSMALATALIGPLGLAAGARTTSTSTSEATVSKLALKLYVNDLHTPCFEIAFLDFGVGLKPSNPMVQEAAKELDAWYGRFQSILVGIERNGVPDGAAVEHNGPVPAPAVAPWKQRVFSA
jgi:hypothetical protein